MQQGHVEVDPGDESFSLEVRTVHVGRLDEARSVPLLVTTHAEGQEAVLIHEEVEERYLAGPLGLEQTFNVKTRPEGAGPLAIEVGFDGLTPEPAPDATSVVLLLDDAGEARAVYRDVAAMDAEGRDLAAYWVVGASSVTLVVDDEAAAYPVVVDPLIALQQAKLTASDGATNDRFGLSVSVSEDTALIGQYLGNAAHVYVRSGTSWTEQAILKAGSGNLGGAVSVSQDTALTGSSWSDDYQGSAYVFVRSGTSWTQQAKLTASDGAPDDTLTTEAQVDFATTAAAPTRGASRHGTVQADRRLARTL